MHRFPENTETTADIAIAGLEAHEALANDAVECFALWQSLSKEARAAAEAPNPDWPKIKALWLAADACSMMLRGDSANEPFKPMAVFESGRSAVPEDFTVEDAAILSKVAEKMANGVLRARLADLAWLRVRPKQIADARRAIEAYVEVPPTQENHPRVLKGWQRAITLCLQLGRGERSRLEKIEADLAAIAEREIPLDGSLGLVVARTLFVHRLGSSAGEKISALLAEQGERLVAAGDFFRARGYFGLACEWYAKMNNEERAADMTLAMALSCEAEADQRINADQTAGHLVAGSFLEDAIQTLRKIPQSQRARLGAEAHLERLLKRLSESGQQAIKSMQTVSSGPVDIAEIVHQSEQAVSGKPALQALMQFVHLHNGANVARLTENAKSSMREFFFSSMFGATHYGPDGRVIAKTPAGHGSAHADQDVQVFATVMRHYLLDVELICRGQILPATATILREHNVTKADLAQLMFQSPIVPPGRAAQFAKALWEGFEHDFSSAIYLLAPQIEHLVRWHLKQAGAATTRLDSEGIENEVGLSTLIEDEAAKRLFGEDTLFELQALFCTAYGPNLRNQVAHGLLSDDECHTSGAVYAWWWVLRLTLRSLLQAIQKTGAPSTQPATGDPSDDH